MGLVAMRGGWRGPPLQGAAEGRELRHRPAAERRGRRAPAAVLRAGLAVLGKKHLTTTTTHTK